jgi:ATP-binding cassette subfamily F protein uup
VKALSGGERNRIMLAKLFMRPSNLMVLDEPTNDLDIETLELLEEQVMNYKGTVLLVSHDRQFINNVVTSTLVFEGDGKVQEYAGGYDDWLFQRKQQKQVAKTPKKSAQETKLTPKKVKLSFKEKYELENLPKEIETLEHELAEIQTKLANPDFYKNNTEIVSETNNRLIELQTKLDHCFVRWEELESRLC